MSLQSAHELMRTDDAWNTTTGSREVIVAIIDHGFILENSDLIDNWYINQEEIRGKFGDLVKDTDNDGRITFIDLNHEDNFGLCGPSDGLVSSCDIVGSNGRVTPIDLISGDFYTDPEFKDTDSDGIPDTHVCKKLGQRIGDELPFIGFENGIDDDGNGKCDDLIGWDFDGSDNYPGVKITATNQLHPCEASSHGNGTSYTIGGLGPSGSEICYDSEFPDWWGIAWGGVSIMPIVPKGDSISVSLDDEETTVESIGTFRSSIIFGIEYALSKQAHIINLSLGAILYADDAEGELDGDCTLVSERASGIAISRKRYDAIYAGLIWDDVDGLGLGETLLVAASGDCETNIGPDSTNGNVTVWPCEMQHPNVICVGSVGRSAASPVYNFGPDAVDIAAQYYSSAMYSVDGMFASYGTCDGTSFSGPHISGALALMLSHNPSLRSDALAAVNQLYCNTIENANSLQYFTHGIVDMDAAVNNTHSETPNCLDNGQDIVEINMRNRLAGPYKK